MQFPELACSYTSLHAVTQACMQFLFSSEQLTRISQCLFSEIDHGELVTTLEFFANPPPHPGQNLSQKDPEFDVIGWQKIADKFASYYLVLFRPEENLYEEGQANSYEYDWNALLQFVKELKDSKREVNLL